MLKWWMLGMMSLVVGEVYAMEPMVAVRNVDLYERVYVDRGTQSLNPPENHVPRGGLVWVQFVVEKMGNSNDFVVVFGQPRNENGVELAGEIKTYVLRSVMVPGKRHGYLSLLWMRITSSGLP